MSDKQRIATFSQHSSHVVWEPTDLLTSSMQAQLARTAAELHETHQRAVLETMRDSSVAKFKEKFGNAIMAKKASLPE